MADINETNKEVILTESAVKQLIKNIKDADGDIIENINTSNTQLNDKIDNLISISSSSSNDNYIASIEKNQTSGQITITTAVTTQDYTNTNSVNPTSNKAITAAINTLNYDSSNTNGDYINFVKQINGKITSTKASFTKPSISIHSNDDNGLKLKITTDGGSSDALNFPNASENNLGVVKIGDNINCENGVISVAKISSCIALNNKELYISKLSSETGNTASDIDGNGKIIISADGKTITYTITDSDLGGNASTSDLSSNSVIMVAPVYGDNPNENLCYTKVANDKDFDAEYTYYIFDVENKIFEKDTTVSQSNWNSKKEYLYTKNEGSDTWSSWDWWDSYRIICEQGDSPNKLKFYLNNAVTPPDLSEANLPDTIKQRIQIRINIAIFL